MIWLFALDLVLMSDFVLAPLQNFFEKLNRICYMWMPCSDGLYSLPDSPEPSLSDLFGSSTTSDGSSIASVVDGIARARTDDDSVETDTASTHVQTNTALRSATTGGVGVLR